MTTATDLNNSPIISAFAFDDSDDALVDDLVEFLDGQGVKDLLAWERSGTLRLLVLGPARCRLAVEEFEGETCSIPDLYEDMHHNSNTWVDPITNKDVSAVDQAEEKYDQWVASIWGSGEAYVEEKSPDERQDSAPRRNARRGGRQRASSVPEHSTGTPSAPASDGPMPNSTESAASIADRIIRAAKGESTGGFVTTEE